MTQTKPNLHNTIAGALLPLAQSFITGILIFLLVLLLTYLLEWRKPLTWAALIGLLSWLAAWLLLQAHWFSLTKVEQFIGMDLDGDGITGPPPAKPEPIRIDMTTKDKQSYTRKSAFIHATPEQMKILARGLILDKKPLAESTWCGPGKPFSLLKFRALRSDMLDAGLIFQRSAHSRRQGYELTHPGRVVLRKILTDQLPHSMAGSPENTDA